MLMEEYRDGILLFNLTDEKVWTKAIRDTTGLESFYEQHKMDYMWGERLDATICAVNDNNLVEEARKLLKKGNSKESILEKLNQDTLVLVFVEERLYSNGDNDLIDGIEWKKGLTSNYPLQEHPEFKFDRAIADGAIFFIRINGIVPPSPKSLDEARGLITSDYQNYLEQEWIKELKQKYPVTVDREVLSTIK